jgi:hypothetical protein
MKEYAELLHAIADGKQLQWESQSVGWVTQTAETCLKEFLCREYPPARYRIEPVTININGFEVPEPMRVAPPFHSEYWTLWIYRSELGCAWNWINSEGDRKRLSRGICHTTKEAAEAHAKALLSFTEVQP